MDDEVYASALQLGQLHKNNNGDEIKADYGQTQNAKYNQPGNAMTGRNRYRVHVARFTIGYVVTAVGSHQVSAEIGTLPDDL